MKKKFLIILLGVSSIAFAQKKKQTKIMPPPPVKQIEPPQIIEPPEIEHEGTKCFVYKKEEKKDALIYVTETLLEYGWNNDMARMIITNYEYDPIAEKEAEEKGYVLAQSKQLQFIDGHFKITNDTFTFTPTNTNEFKTEIFKINFENKTKKVKQLKNQDDELFVKGACLEPMVSM